MFHITELSIFFSANLEAVGSYGSEGRMYAKVVEIFPFDHQQLSSG